MNRRCHRLAARPRTRARCLGVLAAFALAACVPGDPQSESGSEAGGTLEDASTEVLSSVTEEGPVRATVTLAPAAPRLGDPLTLELVVASEPRVSLEMPEFGEALDRFSILDFAPRRETTEEGGTVASQRYTLQAPMSGRLRVPALRIEYADERDGADDGYRELMTDEIAFEVASVLPAGAVVDALLPARAPLSEDRSGWFATWWAALVALALAVGAGLWGVAAWQRRVVAQARVTAHQRALHRLRELEQRGFPRTGEADAWYVELSDIVRRYVEDRYAVRAPELTTEEFLVEARRSFSGSHRDLLSAFLARCDRVKFARYSPEQRESSEVLSAARQFLDETRSEPAPPVDEAA